MQLAMKARGTKLSEQRRAVVEHKTAKLPRVEPKVTRCEVELIEEHHRDGIKRVELAVDTPRKTFRAHGEGPEFEAALDKALARIERQMREYRKRKRTRVLEGAHRLKLTTRRTAEPEQMPTDVERT